MNTARLAKLYDRLTAAERFALLLAAAARGDEAERDRLVDAAPRVAVRVPDTFSRAMAFREVMDQHRMERLSIAALLFRAHAQAAEAEGAVKERVTDVARLLGYLVGVYRDGWAAFCEGLGVTAAGLEALLPGDVVLDLADGLAEYDGFTPEEAANYARRLGRDRPAALKTAASVAAELRAAYDVRRAWWDGE